ncbi:MAG: hypothetical protein LAT75_07080 [Candidatus Cyclonatronum sp.]|uniref:hypothetical protein n=1 Tax=Cyclonatronum sp. TaxID=3024185 RepID=UPI0025BF6C65|nr:hypothetical protein [Cyclonatronum sp.]MCC5932910.1 hypothetical protein [Balneolales bacterium]MCH8486611.1 hypothetical protein [Cyclonatronum sp.]
MIWYLSIALSVTLLYVLVRFLLIFNVERNTKFLWWAGASLFYFLSSSSWLLLDFNLIDEQTLDRLNLMGWAQVSGVSLLLTALSIENWEDRPLVARYPYAFNFAPLALIPAYILLYQTVYLQEVMIGIYEGGAIFVALLLFGLFTSKMFEYIYSFLGIVLVLLSFVVFWFPAETVTAFPWVWMLIATTGVLIFVSGYQHAVKQIRLEEAESED